ncbi:MAG: tetratricopeptide repeat protein [Polyangiaceae bacterium]|nr:tetratricopeptide repeat protein [Polyangiaceae bacterium]
MRTLTRLAIFAFISALTGCGATAVGPAQTPGTDNGKPAPVTEVPETVVSPFTDDELVKQFEHGQQLMMAGKVQEAAAVFDKLVRLAPDGQVAPPSLYNAGIAHEDLGDRAAAIQRYTDLTTRFPAHSSARSALFRLTDLHAYEERWPDLVSVSEQALALTDLTVLEKIRALGSRALGHAEQEHLPEAERDVGKARDLIEDHRLGESGKPPLELVQVSFALGEVRRLKSEKIALSPLPPNFSEVLEQRCQALLDAQTAYTEAMRGYDAHWSAMSGYRVGQLYQKLHSEVIQIPPTAQAKTLQQKQLFEATMRLRYRILLEKGLKMMEGTVKLAERTGENSGWVARARDAKRDLEVSLAEEKAALAKMPFTEDEVREAMEKLKTQAPKPAKP